jgi:hypothetical protein
LPPNTTPQKTYMGFMQSGNKISETDSVGFALLITKTFALGAKD